MKLSVSSKKVIANKICELRLSLANSNTTGDKRQQVLGAIQALRYLEDLDKYSAKTAYTGSPESIFVLQIDNNTEILGDKSDD